MTWNSKTGYVENRTHPIRCNLVSECNVTSNYNPEGNSSITEWMASA